MNKHIEKVKILEFQCLDEISEGKSLVIVEGTKNIPFEIKRIFYIFGGSEGLVRGKHANRKSQFVLFNISGTCKVRVIDENNECFEYSLDAPNKALYLPEMVWKEMYDFSENSVLMVLTNEYYDSGEYIRNFSEYQDTMNALPER